MLNWQTEIAAMFAHDVLDELNRKVESAFQPGRHGDWPRWQAAIAQLPECDPQWSIEQGMLCAGGSTAGHADLAELLKELIPWRKGPIQLGGVFIDTEWRSDWKWNRIASNLDIEGHRVLDIGAGNGYFGFQMLNAGARSVIGCDPTLLFIAQYQAIRHFSGSTANLLLPLRFEEMPTGNDFDSVFSMGVLYHRRDPLEHLRAVIRQLHPGGQFLLETLIIPGDADTELDPPGRYANMRNVHRLPSQTRLMRWLEQAGYSDAKLIDQTATTPNEQKTTPWMPFHSLADALQADRNRTLEGHPPPLRAVIQARR